MENDHRSVHLVGSLPFKTVREVFDAVGPALGGYAKRLPDGEAQGWVDFPAAALGHAVGLVKSDRIVRKMPELPAYALLQTAKGFEAQDIEFKPVGYDKIAIASYREFVAARSAGRIAPGTRFQVSLPTPFAVIGIYVIPEQVQDILLRFEHSYLQEIDKIVAAIPAEDLAIQWDIAVEIVAALMGYFPGLKEHVSMDFLAQAVARASERVPSSVELGWHFCYGNAAGRNAVQPDDMGLMVEFCNSILSHVTRPVTWVHMPVPIARDDDAYFAPLRALQSHRIDEFYLGLVHPADGVEGARRRMTAAKKYSPHFGVGWQCGMRLFSQESMPQAIELHRQVAELE